MSFRFALAPLLRLRQGLERQHALHLQQANLNLARARETLAQLDLRLLDAAQADAHQLTTGSTGAELQFASLLRSNLARCREELLSGLRQLEELRQRAAVAYHQAYREREILEGLRLRQLQAHEQEELRREQQDLDATHLLQRWHRQN